jgi:hypothetical protein
MRESFIELMTPTNYKSKKLFVVVHHNLHNNAISTTFVLVLILCNRSKKYRYYDMNHVNSIMDVKKTSTIFELPHDSQHLLSNLAKWSKDEGEKHTNCHWFTITMMNVSGNEKEPWLCWCHMLHRINIHVWIENKVRVSKYKTF